MISIGYRQLGVPLGVQIRCQICGNEHTVEQSPPSVTYHSDGSVTQSSAGLLQFYTCNGNTYLAGVRGRRFRATDEDEPHPHSY